jgi:hypothetical protein
VKNVLKSRIKRAKSRDYPLKPDKNLYSISLSNLRAENFTLNYLVWKKIQKHLLQMEHGRNMNTMIKKKFSIHNQCNVIKIINNVVSQL